MIFAALVGLSLVTTVGLDAQRPSPGAAIQQPRMTTQQKSLRLRRLIRSATDCVVREVSADPRFAQSMKAGNVTTLIVESMASCTDDMRAMIDAYDRLYGVGAGEAFFMGPYLDVLPSTVNKLIAQ
jgi:hypothetical protein